MKKEQPKRRRTEPPEIRRTQILEAAKACFVKSGFSPTKVADIAEHAGISVGLVYRYFPSKEALVEAIVAEDAQDQTAKLLDLFEEEGATARSAIKRFVETIPAMLIDRGRSALLLEVAAEMARNDKIRTMALGVQRDALAGMRDRLRALSHLGMEPDEFGARLRVVSALSSGAAVQLAASSETPDDLFFDLIKRTAESILLAP